MDKTAFIEAAKALASSYKISDPIRQQLSHVRVVAFVGPTGVGKTTLLKESGLPFVRSDVSRLPRDGERNGRDYNFRTDYVELLNEVKAEQFVQYVINSNNEFYGTKASEYPEGGNCGMAIIAKAIPQFRSLGFAEILPLYVLPPSYVDWISRIGDVRHDDLQARFAEARESLPLAVEDPDYHFVLNDNLDDALADIRLIIEGKPISEHREFLAKQTAELLIGRLGED